MNDFGRPPQIVYRPGVNGFSIELCVCAPLTSTRPDGFRPTKSPADGRTDGGGREINKLKIKIKYNEKKQSRNK